MNYLFLKNIISNLTSEFICPNCRIGKPKEEFLDISKISTSNMEVVFECPHCKTKNLLKAEFVPVNLPIEKQKELFEKFSKKWKLVFDKKRWIPAEEIKKIEEKLNDNITVTDLMGNIDEK